MSPTTVPLVTPLVQPAADAQRQLATDDGAIEGVGQAHGNVQNALYTYDTDAGSQTRTLQGGWEGSSADRQAADVRTMSTTSKDISEYSAEVQSAVRDAAGILKVGQNTNQQLIDNFMDKAAELLSAASALRAAGDHAGAQAKISELIRLGAQVSGESSTNLEAVMSQLTGVVDRLNGGGATTPASAENQPPAAYNSPGGGGGGGGGGDGGGGGGGGGVVTKKRLPVAIPPQPGTGVAVNLPDGSTVMAPNETAAKAVRAALGQLGVPYVWGGTAPGVGLDCSGLTQYAYGEAGLDIPRTSREQDIGAEVPSADQLLPGDLVCWEGHVAMYIGNGQIVEAGDPVQVGDLRTTNSGMPFVGFYRPTG
ncbi:C40 family peptidase [Actinophytocola algeriensis]|uniref:Cell wall-associated NlpC family hydrolase n=1 Tax=Actinophytocola algeriensis TaxID=1768010 RepID=A0A7W7VBC6_9PSEU|nr:C40 family peptidase [Actinophytocola algeriensis]MBB4903852.1 cell wall-associated NlpC family hydrolase [Actinophytocola algeriensis]MBE1477291.1 cell wall-associated NlpC family hydrolase [Actinophytocola algeriensis]